MKKFKNPILISSIISLTFIILNSLDVIKISNEKVEVIINLVLTILISLGIISNPDKKITLRKYSKNNFEGQDDFD